MGASVVFSTCARTLVRRASASSLSQYTVTADALVVSEYGLPSTRGWAFPSKPLSCVGSPHPAAAAKTAKVRHTRQLAGVARCST